SLPRRGVRHRPGRAQLAGHERPPPGHRLLAVPAAGERTRATALLSGARRGAAMSDAVIIEAAINGVTTKEQNPNTPRPPEEIAVVALRCLDAGAAIVHNHVDVVAVSGEEAAVRYLEGWKPVWEQRPDALLYPTFNYGLAGENTAHEPVLAAAG